MDPFDKSQCSFPVPDFASAEEEIDWVRSLTPQQRLELLHLTQLARYGSEALARGIDRTHIERLTMSEFAARKEQEDEEEESWRLRNGWPARTPAVRQQLLRKRGEVK